jgi:hypothetical protein
MFGTVRTQPSPRSYGFNMRVIKELALAEPLVDSVNPDQVGARGHGFVRAWDSRSGSRGGKVGDEGSVGADQPSNPLDL